MKQNKKIISIVSIVLLVVVAIILYFSYFRSFQVDFDPQGGTWIATMQVRINNTIVKPQDPIREGYVFDGWYLDDEPYDFTSPVKENLTLVAHWKEK